MRYFILLLAALFFLPKSINAGTLHTRNGQIVEGDLRFEPGGSVQVLPKIAGEFPLVYKISDLTAIELRTPLDGIRSGGTLPGDWSVLDIGSSVDGQSQYDQGEFTLRGGGARFGSAADTCHYVYHHLPSDGQLIVRVLDLSGKDSNRTDLDPLAQAGLMIRHRLEPAERFCAIAITAEDGPRFYIRPAVDGPVNVTPVVSKVKIKPPYWLKLARYGEQMVASVSHDGKIWERIATPKIPLMRDAYIGLYVNSNRPDQLATAVFDHVRVTIHGLRGEYFADTQFKESRLTRLDPQINFLWYGGAPDPNLASQGFSVRWTGQVLAPSTDTYRFAMHADSAARLFINDKIVLDTGSKVHRDGTVSLIMDQRYDIRIDYYAGSTTTTACKLLWSTTAQAEPEVIPSEYFYYTPPAHAQVSRTPFDPAAPRTKPYINAKGVLLIDGSYIPGSVLTADDKVVTFNYRDQKQIVIATNQVAWVVLHPLGETATRIPAKGIGLLTLAGDFIEGECQDISIGKVKLASVVFGVSTYDTASQTAAVIYREAGHSDAVWKIRTIGGGEIDANSFRVEGELMMVEEPLVGPIEFRLSDIVDVTIKSPSR